MQENRSTQTECSTGRCVKLGWPSLSRWIQISKPDLYAENFFLSLKNCFLPGGVALVYFIQPSISVSLPLGCVSQMSGSHQFTFATSTHSCKQCPNHDAFTVQSPTSGEKICKILDFGRTVHWRERHGSICLWIIHSVWPRVIQTNQLGA